MEHTETIIQIFTRCGIYLKKPDHDLLKISKNGQERLAVVRASDNTKTKV
jgi:hypothetical protein